MFWNDGQWVSYNRIHAQLAARRSLRGYLSKSRNISPLLPSQASPDTGFLAWVALLILNNFLASVPARSSAGILELTSAASSIVDASLLSNVAKTDAVMSASDMEDIGTSSKSLVEVSSLAGLVDHSSSPPLQRCGQVSPHPSSRCPYSRKYFTNLSHDVDKLHFKETWCSLSLLPKDMLTEDERELRNSLLF